MKPLEGLAMQFALMTFACGVIVIMNIWVLCLKSHIRHLQAKLDARPDVLPLPPPQPVDSKREQASEPTILKFPGSEKPTRTG